MNNNKAYTLLLNLWLIFSFQEIMSSEQIKSDTAISNPIALTKDLTAEEIITSLLDSAFPELNKDHVSSEKYKLMIHDPIHYNDEVYKVCSLSIISPESGYLRIEKDIKFLLIPMHKKIICINKVNNEVTVRTYVKKFSILKPALQTVVAPFCACILFGFILADFLCLNSKKLYKNLYQKITNTKANLHEKTNESNRFEDVVSLNLPY